MPTDRDSFSPGFRPMSYRARIQQAVLLVIAISCVSVAADIVHRLALATFRDDSPKDAPTLRDVGVVPSTVVLQETMVDDQGDSHEGGRYIRAVRSDGSYVLFSQNTFVRQYERLIVLRTSNGTTEIRTNEQRRIRAERPGSGDWQFSGRDPARGCLVAWSDGNSRGESTEREPTKIAGYPVDRVTTPGGHVAWYAPDLGCAMLKAIYAVREQKSIRVAVDVKQGEPDKALFDVADLRLVSFDDLLPPGRRQGG